MTLLTTRLTERRGSYQGLARIRPTIRLGRMGVRDLKRVTQTGCKVWGGTAVAPFQKTPRQAAQPPLHWVEPGALLGRQVAHLRMARSAQERPPLDPAAPVLGHTGPLAPLGDQTAAREAPVGMEMLHPPVGARPIREWLDDVGQRRGAILTGACLAQMPDDWSRGDDARGDPGAYPMPDVLGHAFLRFPRGTGRCGGCAWQHRPAGLCIGANAPTPLGTEAEGVAV
jgi:hypothetical protein